MKHFLSMILWLTVALLVSLPLYMHAQPTDITVGDKVKIYAPSYVTKYVVGRVYETSSFSLIVTSGDKQVIIPYNVIKTMKVSVGQRNRWILGLALGYVSGALIASLANSRPENELDRLDNGINSALGATIGAVLGLGIGTTIKRDRWKKVSIGLAFNNTLKKRGTFDIGPSVRMRIPIKR